MWDDQEQSQVWGVYLTPNELDLDLLIFWLLTFSLVNNLYYFTAVFEGDIFIINFTSFV